MKMLIPSSLAKDYRELEYIESIGKSKLSVSENVHMILTIEGSGFA